MSALPKISIIIPVYNGEQYIAEAIQTALAQNYMNKEVIVINDGSSDQTEKICQSFSDQIRYHYQENKGLGVSRNQGVLLAEGSYLAFLDCDDVWEREKLTRQMQAMENNALVFSMIKQFYCPTLLEHEKEKIVFSQEVMAGCCASCLLISRERFFSIGFFPEIKEVGEFIEWYGRAQLLQSPVKIVNEVLAYRRIHRNNMGRQKEKYSRQEYLKVLKRNLDLKRKIKEAK